MSAPTTTTNNHTVVEEHTSTATVEEVNTLFEHATAFVPEAEEQAQPMFLILAPITSASYPVRKAAITKVETKKDDLEAVLPSKDEIDAALAHKRRSSSMGSNSSGMGRQRFLRLGPVHHGVDDGEGDWSEVVIAE